MQRQAQVKTGLTAQGRQNGVGPLGSNDFLQDLGNQRLDVGAICRFRIRHNGRGIGVHQYDFIAFFAQGLAGLGAGIVKFAGLTDDDGPGSD